MCIFLCGCRCPVAYGSTALREVEKSCMRLTGYCRRELDTGERIAGHVAWQRVDLRELMLLRILGQLEISTLAAVLTVGAF